MKHELNSQTTKQLLADAMIQLAGTKPFSKIKVSELVALCDINRKTFYYHFADVYDLLEWYLNGEIAKAIRSFDSFYNLDATITFATEYMQQHPYLARFIEDPIGREIVTQTLTKVISPLADDFIQKMIALQDTNTESDFQMFLSKTFTRITVLSILDTIENPNDYDIGKFKRYISMLFTISPIGQLPDSPPDLLKNLK